MVEITDPIIMRCATCRKHMTATLAQLRQNRAFRCVYCGCAGVPDAYDLVQAINQASDAPPPLVRLKPAYAT
jgi:hypothetical protein